MNMVNCAFRFEDEIDAFRYMFGFHEVRKKHKG